jgi:HNH endonuclease
VATLKETAQTLKALYSDKVRIHRCVGTNAELERWRLGESFIGWDVKGGWPRRGDLVLGVTGTPVYIFDLSCVARLVGTGVKKYARMDRTFPVVPMVSMASVISRLNGKVGSRWSRLDGDQARDFVDALAEEVLSRTATSDTEGNKQLRRCGERSRKNRKDAIEREQGRCQCCNLDLRGIFGEPGDRALEAHHIVPLGRRPSGTTHVSSRELMVLCATCHRLLHTDPKLDEKALSNAWMMAWARSS